jgi:hypothetical protein
MKNKTIKFKMAKEIMKKLGITAKRKIEAMAKKKKVELEDLCELLQGVK